MVYGSLLRNPKEEEQDDDDQIEGIDDIMEDLEGFLGIEEDEEEEFSELVLSSWDFMDLEFPKEEEYVDIKVNVENVKKENVGFWDIKEEEEKRLCLNLNYQEVLDAWSDRGSLWADQCSLSMASSNNASYMGEVPVMEEDRSSRREASVLRYKEKRQNRLFSKKIRYQVRKLNADKRPRLKGRFVKRGGS